MHYTPRYMHIGWEGYVQDKFNCVCSFIPIHNYCCLILIQNNRFETSYIMQYELTTVSVYYFTEKGNYMLSSKWPWMMYVILSMNTNDSAMGPLADT